MLKSVVVTKMLGRLKQEGALLGATEATVVYIIGSRVAQAT